MIYIWNELIPLPANMEHTLNEELDGIDLVLLPASHFGVRQEHIAADGWITQQALKLQAACCVLTESYLVLDAKNHFVRPSSERDFVAEDGRSICALTDLRSNSSYRYCLEYFGVTEQQITYYCALNLTPFIFRTSLVRKLLTSLVTNDTNTAADTLLAHKGNLSEFLVYQTFHLSKGGKIADLIQDTDTTRDVLFWGVTVFDNSNFNHCMELVMSGNVKLIGLHWVACYLLTTEQRTRLCNWWLGQKLIRNETEGHEIIESVARGLNEDDKRFLQKYIDSLAHKPRPSPA